MNMSYTQHKDGDLASALRSIDEVLAHFQTIGELARDARSKLAAYQEPAQGEPRHVLTESMGPSASGGRAVPTAPATPRSIVRLTRRQQQVLELLVQGVTNRRIGRTLHITEQTVKAHLHMIYRKLGVTDRTEAVVIAMRSALVPRHLRDDIPLPRQEAVS